ncbi:helicase-related protein [Actinopolymorpha pittospori]|uniref:helicase-related protein n=1 Tax=Actinopolymorpha pittospori TaxID=648752 RepID=UPI0031E7A2A9
MAPVQREVVEAAFAEGLLKVAFATETLALGVNLPARTVVIDRVLRASGELLDAGEFAQLAGRAGRRGIDVAGHVVVPWSPHVPFHRVGALVGGHLAAIRSAFRVTPAMALNLVRTGTPDEARATVESSLRHRCAQEQAAILRTDLAARQAELAELAEQAESDALVAARDETGTARRDSLEADLAGVRPGDVVVDTGRPSYGPTVVLAVSTKRGATCVEAIHTSGRASRSRRRACVAARLSSPTSTCRTGSRPNAGTPSAPSTRWPDSTSRPPGSTPPLRQARVPPRSQPRPDDGSPNDATDWPRHSRVWRRCSRRRRPM